MRIAKIYYEGKLVAEVEHDTIKKCLDTDLVCRWFNLFLNDKEVGLFGLGYSFVIEEKQNLKCDHVFQVFEIDGKGWVGCKLCGGYKK